MQEGAGPRPFDVATRHLIEADPAGWLRWVGLPVNGPIRPLESDVSTVLAEVDKVLRIEAERPWLAHFELQVSRDRWLPSRMLQYYGLLRYRDRVPVESTVVLLRPEADCPEMSGRLDEYGITGAMAATFWFRVIRIWERPVDELLSSGFGLLPLAPLADVRQERLPAVIRHIEERFEREAPPGTIGELWAATHLLLGLRYDADVARILLQGVSRMRESSTYQAILAEGRAEGRAEGETRGQIGEARRLIMRLGSRKFGPPDGSIVRDLEGLDNLPALEGLHDRLLTAQSWNDLLSTEPER